MIQIEGLRYSYPKADAPALEAVTTTIDEGSFVVIAGDSGSGKSTLARAMVGLVPHFHGGSIAGRIVVDGRDTRRVQPRDMADVVAFVDQDPEAQSVVDRVEGEIAFGMENLAVEPLVMRKRIEELLDALGIAALRERALETLSGGERQRVAIAAALGTQPRCLVLDEPTSQLDPQSAEDVLAVLQRLNADLGITIVLVEHRLERVVQYADRLIAMADGHIVADGDPRAVLATGHVTTPLSRLATGLGWDSIPLTVREGRALAARVRSQVRVAPKEERPAGTPAIVARGLQVAHGGTQILRGVDLSVAAGETLAIVGRNGSGKTTLLRALMGLIRSHAGTRSIAGFDPARHRVEDIAARVAYVPQSADSLLFADTVRDEVAFTLRARAPSDDASEVIERAGLTALAEADPRALSAGQRLRVALLAATAGDPAVVLLDEPTRGMDARGKEQLAEELARWREQDRATIIVTHDVELVATVATRVLLLAEGRVVIEGPAREVLGESVLFSSQMNKVFGDRRIATVADALAAVR